MSHVSSLLLREFRGIAREPSGEAVSWPLGPFVSRRSARARRQGDQ
jgi:hypothetical protein